MLSHEQEKGAEKIDTSSGNGYDRDTAAKIGWRDSGG